jgi:sporulation protein YlmC with PRC-barrel domain
MTSKETLAGMQGIPVITTDEGTNLGYVTSVYVDPESRKLSALALRHRKMGKEAFVDNADITLIGRDVIMIRAADAAKILEEGHDLGRRVHKLRGMPVTTDAGRTLGRLEDFDIDDAERVVTELHFADGSRLHVDATQLTIGPDEIILPAVLAERVVKAPEKPGFFARARHLTDRWHEKRAEESKQAQHTH